MAVNRHGISRDLLIHPGETIADLLEERGMSQKELAKRSGVSEPFLSDVIRGKKDISKSLAKGLEYALGIPGSFWLNLQANYDAELLTLQEEETVIDEERRILKSLRDVVKYLSGISVISSSEDEQIILQLRKYLRVSNLTVLRDLVPAGAFRMSESVSVNPDVLGAWLCLCDVNADPDSVSGVFDKTKTDHLIHEIKAVMCSSKSDTRKALKSVFARYGIDFSVVHNFRGAPVHGYIERKANGTYQMAVTIRGAYADIFWFSVFHELGHIVNGDLNRQGYFIDSGTGETKERENAADHFASEALLNPDDYETFVCKESYTLQSIKTFAESQNVPVFIVIGRLQKEEKIPWNRFAGQKPRYRWAEE